jgi:AI-2 transport protein TqsA
MSGTQLALVPAVPGKGTKTLLMLALGVVVAAGLKASASLLVPLLVAAFIAAATQPVVDYLTERGLPTFLAVLVTILAVAAFIVGFGALLAVAVGAFGESMPSYQAGFSRAKLQIAGWLGAWGLSRGAASVQGFELEGLAERLLAELALATPGAVSATGIVVFVMIFILLEAATFRRKVRRALHWAPQYFEDVRHAGDDLKKYLLVKTALSAVTGLLCGIVCALFGLDAALLWGLLAFLLNFIPNIGSVIAAVPPVAIALVQYGFGRAAGILLGYLVINNLIGNLLEPKVLGRALGLSPLVIVLSVIIWGWLLGPVGALLSVPITMTLKILFANTEDLRWLAVLLGAGDGSEEEAYIERRAEARRERVRLTTDGVSSA